MYVITQCFFFICFTLLINYLKVNHSFQGHTFSALYFSKLLSVGIFLNLKRSCDIIGPDRIQCLFVSTWRAIWSLPAQRL